MVEEPASTNRQAGEGPATGEPVQERRSQDDRRRLTWKTVVQGFLHPRRREARRQEPHGYYVDYHDARLWIPVGGILLLSIVDAALALGLVSLGGREGAVSAADLVTGKDVYLAAAKVVGIAIGVLLLTAVDNFRILGLLRGRSLLYLIFAGYAGFIAYELVFRLV